MKSQALLTKLHDLPPKIVGFAANYSRKYSSDPWKAAQAYFFKEPLRSFRQELDFEGFLFMHYRIFLERIEDWEDGCMTGALDPSKTRETEENLTTPGILTETSGNKRSTTQKKRKHNLEFESNGVTSNKRRKNGEKVAESASIVEHFNGPRWKQPTTTKHTPRW
ncbi:hypothetical protein G7Y89_g10460 [Cudoniella acicularis]|uniref:Uncharacterized protein n=1 Tax=Cudoniella acicularis TaxID=354080 RepID=A0A8H4RCR5_9HELO|nr:hypothetical protein G7Y89_g10460 [Cudoniella acicularis]